MEFTGGILRRLHLRQLHYKRGDYVVIIHKRSVETDTDIIEDVSDAL